MCDRVIIPQHPLSGHVFEHPPLCLSACVMITPLVQITANTIHSSSRSVTRVQSFGKTRWGQRKGNRKGSQQNRPGCLPLGGGGANLKGTDIEFKKTELFQRMSHTRNRNRQELHSLCQPPVRVHPPGNCTSRNCYYYFVAFFPPRFVSISRLSPTPKSTHPFGHRWRNLLMHGCLSWGVIDHPASLDAEFVNAGGRGQNGDRHECAQNISKRKITNICDLHFCSICFRQSAARSGSSQPVPVGFARACGGASWNHQHHDQAFVDTSGFWLIGVLSLTGFSPQSPTEVLIFFCNRNSCLFCPPERLEETEVPRPPLTDFISINLSATALQAILAVLFTARGPVKLKKNLPDLPKSHFFGLLNHLNTFQPFFGAGARHLSLRRGGGGSPARSRLDSRRDFPPPRLRPPWSFNWLGIYRFVDRGMSASRLSLAVK